MQYIFFSDMIEIQRFLFVESELELNFSRNIKYEYISYLQHERYYWIAMHLKEIVWSKRSKTRKIDINMNFSKPSTVYWKMVEWKKKKIENS